MYAGIGTAVLKDIGLTDNEIKIYLLLLQTGSSTAYDIAKRSGIYRAHVYDKLEQLMDKGLVTHVYKGSKKYFHATHPSKMNQLLEDKKREIEMQEKQLQAVLPKLEALTKLSREDTFVEVFKGIEGLKYFLKDIVKLCARAKKEVLITGIDDKKYNDALPVFIKQYFREIRRNRIIERVITARKKGVFMFDKRLAPTTQYRFLEEKQFNPTNTFVYGHKVVIVTWNPVTAIMIRNREIAETYRNHFEHLWRVASRKL